jgi:hypothetical protein
VEMIGSIITAVVSIALGFYVGRLWAPTTSWSLLIGLVCGGICAVGYFGLTVLIGQLAPGTFDPKKIGYWFFLLVFCAPVIGAVGAFLGYRRSPDFPTD